MAISKVNSPYTKIQDVPDVPTIGTATEGEESAEVAFTPATTGGRAYQYRALSSPGSIEAVGSSSPITVPGLTADTTYSFQVRAETNTGATNGYSSASNSIVPTASGSYDLLETTILGSDAASISFTNLNSTYGSDYKHLQVRMVLRTDNASPRVTSYKVRANGDSGSNYAFHALEANGSSVSSTSATSATLADVTPDAVPMGDSNSNIYGAIITDILDPFDTSKNTTFRNFAGGLTADEVAVNLSSGLYMDTGAITSLEFFQNAQNTVAGSRISLYGIKAA